MPIMRAISNRNVIEARFERAAFEGDWLKSIGRPELRGSWIIWGGSGSGKTTFTLMLAKYLSGFRRVAYDSLEQGLSASLQVAWRRVEMADAGPNIILLEREHLNELRGRLKKRWAPKVVVVDSVQYLANFRMSDYVKLMQEYRDVLWIWIAHEDSGKPAGRIANQIRYDSDVKIYIEGYKAFVTTRYEDNELGEGGVEYVIWPEGAAKYWAQII